MVQPWPPSHAPESRRSAPMKTENFESKDGTKLFARIWRPDDQPRGVVVIVHGFKAHSGLYQYPGEELAKVGLAVYALDLRGNGNSGGERYWIDSFDQYQQDVDALMTMVKQREPKQPIFLLGHSAGGVISSHYTLEHQADLAGFICESFAFRVYAPDIALSLLKGASHIAPHAHVLELGYDGFSRDPAFVAAMRADPLVNHIKAPINTVAEMARADDRLAVSFDKFALPLFIMHGDQDKVTVPAGSQTFFDAAGSADKTLKLYEGYAHDLLNDLGKEVVMKDIIKWIEDRLPAARAAAAGK
jgi:acylglycerol lipase